MLRHRLRCVALWGAIAILMTAAALAAFVWFQAQGKPAGQPDYVALGSSFAAGAGLGRLQHGSPLLCARSIRGYPQQLARMRGLSIVDMSCGGAVTRNVLQGGQFFQGPQIAAVTGETRLVTMTVGGNDIGYIGDLSLLAEHNSPGVVGRLVRLFWSGAKRPEQRGYDTLKRTLAATIDAIHARSSHALIVVATYPAILPAQGTCARLAIGAADADTMRRVGDRLAAITRSVATEKGVLLVDMHTIGAGHNACSAAPWTAGWTNATVAPFHPTLAGAKATADAISEAIDSHFPAREGND